MVQIELADLGIRLYLLAYRFPNFERYVQISELFHIGCDARLDVAVSERGRVFSYWAEIARLPTDKCKAQCEDLRAEARRMIELERHASLYLLEGGRPDAPVDYSTWAKMAYWTVDEVSALSVGGDPDLVDWAAVEPHVKTCVLAERFRFIRLQLTRAQHVGQLEHQMRPVDVIDWAQQNAIELPPELVRAVAASPVQVSLRAENEALKQRIKELTEGEQLNPKEKTSLLRITYSYAVQKGYRRGQLKPAARRISDESQLAGSYVCPDTALKYIREAVAAGCGAEPST
jgi:hypothetical protein